MIPQLPPGSASAERPSDPQPRPARGDELGRDVVDDDELLTPGSAGDQPDVTASDAELERDQPEQRLVRGTFDRGCGDADAKDAVDDAVDRVGRRTWRQANGETDFVLVQGSEHGAPEDAEDDEDDEGRQIEHPVRWEHPPDGGEDRLGRLDDERRDGAPTRWIDPAQDDTTEDEQPQQDEDQPDERPQEQLHARESSKPPDAPRERRSTPANASPRAASRPGGLVRDRRSASFRRPLAEQRATDPNDRRPLLDGDDVVVGHPHRQLRAETSVRGPEPGGQLPQGGERRPRLLGIGDQPADG